MSEYAHAILRHVGIVLIVVGMLDIGVMIYCIANEQAYASSLNLFAVIAGIFLMRGSLKAARIVAEASAFLLAAVIALGLASPFIVPLSYLATQFRVNPMSSTVGLLFITLTLVFLWWTHSKMTANSVSEASVRAGIRPHRSIRAFLIGAVIVFATVVGIQIAAHTDSARAAVEKVKREHGNHQQYFLSSFNSASQSGQRVIRATVTGYTSNSINHYEVSWQE